MSVTVTCRRSSSWQYQTIQGQLNVSEYRPDHSLHDIPGPCPQKLACRSIKQPNMISAVCNSQAIKQSSFAHVCCTLQFSNQLITASHEADKNLLCRHTGDVQHTSMFQVLLRMIGGGSSHVYCWNKDVAAVLSSQTESLQDCSTHCCCCYLTVIYAQTADCGTLLYWTSRNKVTWPNYDSPFHEDLTDWIQVISAFQHSLL